MADSPSPHHRGPRLVPAAVANSKFEEQLERWHNNEALHQKRGCLLLSVGDLSVDLGIMQNVPVGTQTLPVMAVCARIDYWNFDIWPPSITFIDPLTREPAPPPVQAIDVTPTGEPRNVLIDQHPVTQQPFLCLPGVREYHTHPQHTGDDWLLHRQRREGDLVVICDRLWRRMARNVMGMSFAMHSTATPHPGLFNNQVQFMLVQGDADLLEQARLAAEANSQIDPAVSQATHQTEPLGEMVPVDPVAQDTNSGGN